MSAANNCRLHFERWGGKVCCSCQTLQVHQSTQVKTKHPPVGTRNKEQGEKNRSGPEVGLNALNQITALTEPGSHLATWARCAAGVRDCAHSSPDVAPPRAEPVPPCGNCAPGKKSRRGKAAGQRMGDRQEQESQGLKYHPASALYGCLQPSHAYTSSLSESQYPSSNAH